MIREYCIENLHNIENILSNNLVSRIELCDDLSIGGISVSQEVLDEAISFSNKYDKGVFAMVRPRGGDFFYSKNEIQIMRKFIESAVSKGVNGLVLGANKRAFNKIIIDIPAIKELVKDINIPLTFHMAFDELDNIFDGAKALCDLGFTRILTHGCRFLSTPIDTDKIRQLIDFVDDKIIIMPGGGVNYKNIYEIEKKTNAKEFHGTKIIPTIVK